MPEEYNPWIGKRISIAWETAIACLIDGEWHDAYHIIHMMCHDADVVPITAANILREAVKAEAIQRQGKYIPIRKRQRKGADKMKDGREFRIHPEGLPDPWHPDCKNE